MPDIPLTALTVAFLRSLPTVIVRDKFHTPDPKEQVRITRLQAAGLIRVKVRDDLEVGAGHAADIFLTEKGAAELARRP